MMFDAQLRIAHSYLQLNDVQSAGELIDSLDEGIRKAEGWCEYDIKVMDEQMMEIEAELLRQKGDPLAEVIALHNLESIKSSDDENTTWAVLVAERQLAYTRASLTSGSRQEPFKFVP